jgi:NAD(P)-dependent dehydrogenase (short-subunit alcohol dehydrogenase family)
MRLKDKIAVITGGNSGIGLAIARTFVREGAKVAIVGRAAESLAAAKAELGGDTLAIAADLTQVAEIERVFAAVKEHFGRVDVLVANAGRNLAAPFEYVNEEAYDALFDTNVKAVFFTVQKALPLLTAGGSVILTSSGLHQKGLAYMAAYNATKAAVRSLARTFAVELAPRKIRVNVVSPGMIETPLHGRAGLDDQSKAHVVAQYNATAPLGRIGEPHEIASAVLFLASEDASYMTAADLVVDGGFTLV